MCTGILYYFERSSARQFYRRNVGENTQIAGDRCEKKTEEEEEVEEEAAAVYNMYAACWPPCRGAQKGTARSV